MDYLSWPDYLILAAFLAISLGIGVYHSLTGGRQKTTTEFIMANRSLKVVPTALSLLVSFQSAILILGITAEMYSYGSLYLVLMAISFVPSMILVMQVAIPWMYPLKLVSVNEYLERRFHSKSVRILAGSISILSAVVYMGTAMYAPSAALQAATGLPIVVSIPVMAVVSIAYTALGGMRAVIWTDVFQSVIIFGGLLAILIKGLVVLGGFANVLELCSQTGRLIWADWNPDPTVRHTFWGFVIGYSMNWFTMYGLSQSGVQRYSATKSQSHAKLTIFLNLPAYLILHLLVCFIGLAVVAYYTSIGCDPLVNGEISNTNQMLPRFVLQMFVHAPGFAGLFLATLYGGALSSVSTSLSGAAANCWEDILQWKLMHWTESRKALLNRLLVVLFGTVATGLAFIASVVPGPITQVSMSLTGAVMGPIYGLFLLGGLNRYANWKGALIGAFVSLVCSFWLIIGAFTLQRRHPAFPPLSIDGCEAPNNLTFPDYDDTNSSFIFDSFNETMISSTMTYFRPQTNQTIGVPLQGLEKFYSISYLWYNLLWILVTFIVGSIASFLLRDRLLEGKVDDKLLINFRQCFRCRANSESTLETYSDANYETVEFRAEANELFEEEPFKAYLKLTPEETSSDRQSNSQMNELKNEEKRDTLLQNTEKS